MTTETRPQQAAVEHTSMTRRNGASPMHTHRILAAVPVSLTLVLGLTSCGASGSRHNAELQPAAPTAAPFSADPTAVSTIDWRSGSYDINCAGLGGPPDRSVPVTLMNGSGRTAPVDWFGSPTPLDVHLVENSAADLTGDGVAEELVHLTCSPNGSNGVADELQVFGPGRALIGHLTLRNPSGSPFAPAVEQVTATTGAIRGTAHYWATSDPHCCPSTTAAFTFVWDAARRRFVEQ